MVPALAALGRDNRENFCAYPLPVSGLIPSVAAISSTCLISDGASGTPFCSRSARRLMRPCPGIRISSTPGSPCELVSADRHEQALGKALAVGDRLTILAADHPAGRHWPALLGIGANGAVR